MSDDLRHITEAVQRVREGLQSMRHDRASEIENELDLIDAAVERLAAQPPSGQRLRGATAAESENTADRAKEPA